MLVPIDTTKLLNKPSIVIKNGNFVDKIYLLNHVPEYDKKDITVDVITPVILTATNWFQKHHPDIFVSANWKNPDMFVVRSDYLAPVEKERKYEEDIAICLKMITTMGFEYIKQDLGWWNIIHSDRGVHILDWDAVVVLDGSEQSAYQAYKHKLTNYEWQIRFGINREQAEEKFDSVWNKL